MIKAGIIGGSGYTGGELIRLLVNHPEVSLNFVYSSSKPGTKIAQAHPDLTGILDMEFTSEIDSEIDVLFLCLGHGHSREFLGKHSFSSKTRIIDLSTDFRLIQDSEFNDKAFVYGLPELVKSDIEKAENIANPGCFATAVQLALLPLAKGQLLGNTVHINGVTGSTGAGFKPSATTHFSWRNNNISWYKPFNHQHLSEINESVAKLQNNAGPLYFLPHRGNFSRGILITAYTEFAGSLDEAVQIYKDYYADAKFTHVADQPVHLKQVVNTNMCHIHLHKHDNILLLTSVLDNLLKGASGQAVQNMNLMFGFDEREGLNLKAGVF